MKILWGPFNHEAIDIYLLKHLSQFNSKTFGSNGADYILPNDSQDPALLPETDFDCVLLIEPLNRLVAPLIFNLDCPIIVCCSQPTGLSTIIDLFDGILPIMQTRKEFDNFGKPIAQTLILSEQLNPQPAQSTLFPVACLGAGVDSLLFENLESIFPDVHYFQGMSNFQLKKYLSHAQYALIPDKQPSSNHFEALRAGSVLLIPDDEALIQALALPREYFRTYNPDSPEEGLKQLLPVQIRQDLPVYESLSLAKIIEKLLEKITLSNHSKKTLSASQWKEYALNVIVHSTSNQSLQRLTLDQALTQQIDKLIQSRTKDLWPDLLSYFKQRTENYGLNDVRALLEILPWHVGIRAGLARHIITSSDLTPAEKTAYIELTLSLLRRSPAWLTLKLEVLNELFLHQVESSERTSSLKPLVLLEGPVYSYTSFARVNLPLLQAWKSSEQFDLVLAHSGRQSLKPEFPDLQFNGQHRLPDIVITHHFPHREIMPNWGKRIAIMPWEYGIAPKHSAQIIQDEIDETWVPSQFNFDIYVRSGVDPERMAVIPNGVDTHLYTDQGSKLDLPTTKSFKFCYVGGTIPRKGFDILLKTYIKTFKPEDDVCLVIKDYGGKDQYSSDSLHHQILKLSQDPSKPAIVYLFTDFMTEVDLTALYRACDVYVHPYRGEGFGMGILEAMACGLPAIIPDQGPAPEFCPIDASWQVSGLTHFMMPSPTKKEFEIQNYTDLPSFYHEPDEFLAKAMKEAYANPSICKQKGIAARQASLNYDWKQIAALAEERICALINPNPPFRLQNGIDKSDPLAQESQVKALTYSQAPELPMLDFDLFHPFVQPQAKGQPYGILSIANWQSSPSCERTHWQSLLLAYSRIQVSSAQTRLILSAQDLTSDQVKTAIQDFCQSQKIRFGKNLQIEVRDMPQTIDEIQELYQKATLFVETDPLSSGQWHLIAQAMGVRCISTGQQVWLKHPYCEIAKSEDTLYLAWLLSKLLPSKQSIFDGLAVRTHLRSRHHHKQMNTSELLLA